MATIQDIFAWLDGKKTYIFAALSLTNSFLGLMKVYDQNTMAYVQGMITILSGGAEYTTVKLGARK